MVKGQKEVSGEQLEAIASQIKGAVWFHAASVGEFEQARPIIERLREEHPEQKIVLTFFSPSGYEMRKNYDKVDKVLYLPFATRRNASRFVAALEPKMAIFVKYEFWPAYLKELYEKHVPTYSISAIFRPNQLFFKPYGKWYLKLLTYFERLFVQDETSARLLQEHGIAQVTIAGDTRFDRVYAIAYSDPKQVAADPRIELVKAFVGDSKQVIVAGSTWPPDEKLFARYINTHPDVKLILVPHEVTDQHLQFIYNEFEGRRCLYTDLEQVLYGRDATTAYLGPRTLVVNTMGLLSKLYRLGQVAYIGGGFGVGIHNTLEAAVYGIPVLFGPNYHHFREAIGLIEHGGGFSVDNYEAFEAAMDWSLENYRTQGAKALEYVRSELGATEIIYNRL